MAWKMATDLRFLQEFLMSAKAAAKYTSIKGNGRRVIKTTKRIGFWKKVFCTICGHNTIFCSNLKRLNNSS